MHLSRYKSCLLKIDRTSKEWIIVIFSASQFFSHREEKSNYVGKTPSCWRQNFAAADFASFLLLAPCGLEYSMPLSRTCWRCIRVNDCFENNFFKAEKVSPLKMNNSSHYLEDEILRMSGTRFKDLRERKWMKVVISRECFLCIKNSARKVVR